MLCDNLEGWDGAEDGREVQDGGGICIPVTDSCWCMTETNTILWSNCLPIKIKKKKKQTKDLHGGPVVKNLPANAGDMGSVPNQGRFDMPQGS